MTTISNTQPQISFSEFLDIGLYFESIVGETVRSAYFHNGKSVMTYFDKDEINAVNPRLFDAMKVIFTQLHSSYSTLSQTMLQERLVDVSLACLALRMRSPPL
jgi:hypothetical protein